MTDPVMCPKCGNTDRDKIRVYIARWYKLDAAVPKAPVKPDIDSDTKCMVCKFETAYGSFLDAAAADEQAGSKRDENRARTQTYTTLLEAAELADIPPAELADALLDTDGPFTPGELDPTRGGLEKRPAYIAVINALLEEEDMTEISGRGVVSWPDVTVRALAAIATLVAERE